MSKRISEGSTGKEPELAQFRRWHPDAIKDVFEPQPLRGDYLRGVVDALTAIKRAGFIKDFHVGEEITVQPDDADISMVLDLKQEG